MAPSCHGSAVVAMSVQPAPRHRSIACCCRRPRAWEGTGPAAGMQGGGSHSSPPRRCLLVLGYILAQTGLQEGGRGLQSPPRVLASRQRHCRQPCCSPERGSRVNLGSPGLQGAELAPMPRGWGSAGSCRTTRGDGAGAGTARTLPTTGPSAPLAAPCGERSRAAAHAGPGSVPSLTRAPTSVLPTEPQEPPAHPSCPPAGPFLCLDGHPEPRCWAGVWVQGTRQRPGITPVADAAVSRKKEALERALDQNNFHFFNLRYALHSFYSRGTGFSPHFPPATDSNSATNRDNTDTHLASCQEDYASLVNSTILKAMIKK